MIRPSSQRPWLFRCSLIALIPRPRCHLVRYHGILGLAAKDRDKVVPTPPAPDAAGADSAGTDKTGASESREIDITKLPRVSRLAAIIKPDAIRKILDHLRIPSEAPRRRPARPPPQIEFPGGDTDAFYADPPSPES